MSKFQPAKRSASAERYPPPRGAGRLGFTLVELLLVISTIAILAGVAIVSVSNGRESTRVAKLESDVATINAAIQVYLVNGGSLPAGEAPNAVLDRLKTRASAATAGTLSGLRGNVVDLRLRAEMQDAGEVASTQTRAIWDDSVYPPRFAIATSGADGVKNFLLDDSLAGVVPATEDRTSTIPGGTNGWVWTYAEPTPAPPGGPGTGLATAGPGANKLQLSPPEFSVAGGQVALNAFDVALTLTNPNGSVGVTSQIYYSVDGGALALYTPGTTLITVTPGMSVSAVATTGDAGWTDSNIEQNIYRAAPISPGVAFDKTQYTFQEAGGEMIDVPVTPPSLPPGEARLTGLDGVAAKYRTSEQVALLWSLDGTTPVSATGTFGPDSWGTASSITLKALAEARDLNLYLNGTGETLLGITPTALNLPGIDPPSGAKAADLPVSIAVPTGPMYPVGYRIYYTLNGADPGNVAGNPTQGTLYTGQFNSGVGTNGVVIIAARVYGPAENAQWFTPSAIATAIYNTITLADGALVGSATLNGTFVGSLIYATPSSGSMNSITFNSGAKILKGNLYLPGTPTIRLSNGTTWSPATDALFGEYIQGWEFDASGNKTVQTTPRVLNEDGSVTPTNYTVSFNKNALLEGKVIRRHDAPAFPTIAPPPPPDSNGSTSLNSAPSGPLSASQFSTVTLNSSGVGDVRLLAGHYANLTANNGTAFVLGDPNNPEITQVYSLNNLTLNSSSDIKVVGKAIVTVSGSITINSGSVLGNSAHPEWLQLQFSSGNFTANSGSTMYGQLVVPNGSVTFNAGSIFVGSVTAQTLTINSSGVVFALPPVIQN